MEQLEKDEKYMRLALALAHEAALAGEVPVGAVVTRGDEVVACGRNRREQDKNALCHAELEAIDAACRKLGGVAVVGVYLVCDAGAMPHVYGRGNQRPAQAAGIWRLRPKGWLMRFGRQPFYTAL